LNKRTKKLFSVGVRASLGDFAPGGEGARAKVFCFFIFDEEDFFSSVGAKKVGFKAHPTVSRFEPTCR
jgi:hypothetical protein